MVQVFKPGRKPRNNPRPQSIQTVTLTFDGFTLDGQALCRQHQPVVMATGGLPGETCEVAITHKKKHVWLGHVVRVETPANSRIQPICPHMFNVTKPQKPACGGCQLGYIHPTDALALKQQTLAQAVARRYPQATVSWTVPIDSDHAYRRKLKLAVDARGPGPAKIGFRQAKSNKVLAVQNCYVAVPELQVLLQALQSAQFGWWKAIGHIELLSVREGTVVYLHARAMLPQQAWAELAQFAQAQDTQIVCNQMAVLGTMDSTHVQQHTANAGVWPEHARVATLTLTDGHVQWHKTQLTLELATTGYIPVHVHDFMQVNERVNEHMVKAAIQALSLDPQDRVLDLFCGSGNFTLPIAQSGCAVLGVEGIASMVEQASVAAREQHLDHACFVHADLTDLGVLAELKRFAPNKLVLDPARDGARAILAQLPLTKFEKIVYISCNPQSWLDDIALLFDAGFKIETVYCMDMFQQTPHTEVFSVFVPTT